ncbi:acyltransferase [Rhizobium sp. S152]|uniref:acyltransferase family protein n=1 Tax=Rhizobium sp. S152 TaxID=3055038 RepID=UPI0025A99CBC|nr:acyltransferase [Rhizobium sp. S152]MDM9626344.1 acyltransferase [Rhizobium sp. S152]
MAPYDFQAIRYIPGLNAMRAFSVTVVMLAHFGFGNIVPGGFGVTAFFFVSGFLITTLLHQEFRRNGSVSLKGFYVRRFLRLMPELIVLLVLSTLYRSALGAPPNPVEVIAALTYTTNYVDIILRNVLPDGFIPVWTQLWSLSVEEHYYITFPAIFAVLARYPNVRLIFFAAILILCPVWRTIIVSFDWSSPDQSTPYTYLASETRFDSIAWGALFAFVAQRPWRIGEAARWAMGTGGLLLFLVAFLVRDPVFRETIRYTLQGIGFFMVFAFLYLGKRELSLMPILEMPLLRTLGVLSYGTYLWHMEYPFFVERIFPDLADQIGTSGQIIYALIGMAVSFGAAYLSYRLVFTPVARIRSQFGRHNPLSASSTAV